MPQEMYEAIYSFCYGLIVPQMFFHKNYDVISIGFQTFFVRAFKIVVDSWKFTMFCYTSYEMTDQFLWFQVQMNNYSSNWNTPY